MASVMKENNILTKQDTRDSNQSPLIIEKFEVTDPATIRSIRQNAGEHTSRQTEFIREALRIGVHALDLATSRAESERLRDTGDQFLKEFQGSITTIQETVEKQVIGTLKEYLDPQSGKFKTSINDFVSDQGVIGTTLRKTIDDVNKSVKSELNLKVGPESNFAKNARTR